MRFVAVVLCFAALLSGAASARADEPRERSSSLSWVRLAGAEACIGGSELARDVQAQLGRSVFVSAAEADLVVEGRAERVLSPAGFRAVVTIADREGASLGERVVDSSGASCDELGRLVAVAIAVMIDPLLPPAPAPRREPPARVIVRTRRVVVPAPRARWHVELESTLGPGLGLLGGVSAAGLAAILIEPPGFVPVVLEGAAFLGRSDGADLLQVQGGVGLCPLSRQSPRLGLAACAGVDAGGLFADARDEGVPNGDRLAVHAHASVHGSLRLVGPLALRAGLHLLVPLRFDDLTVTDERGDEHVLFRPDPLAGLLTLGLGLVFR